VELWLGRILAKWEFQSWKGRMNTSDSVYSLQFNGLWLKRSTHNQDVVRGSRHRDAALDATFRSLKQLLSSRAGLRGRQRGQLPRALRSKRAPVMTLICF